MMVPPGKVSGERNTTATVLTNSRNCDHSLLRVRGESGGGLR